MKRRTKFDSNEQHLQNSAEQKTRDASALEFATADELLRYDASRTPVPERILERLQKSAEDIPAPARSWWRRLFKRSS